MAWSIIGLAMHVPGMPAIPGMSAMPAMTSPAVGTPRSAVSDARDSGVADDGGLADAAEATRLLIQAAFVFWGHFSARAAELGLAPTQAHALMALQPGRPTTMRDVADALECDPSTVTGVADRLEAQGLVERQAQAGDRRVRSLVLTPSGAARRALLMERLAEPTESIRDLSGHELRVLVEVLGRVLEAEAATDAVAARCAPRRPA